MRLQLRTTPRIVDDRWDDGDLAAFAASITGALQAAPAVTDPRAAATRAAVLGAFAARGPAMAAPARTRSRAWLAVPMAASLVAAGALGVMASSAGQPLYGARIALEEVALPASGAARETAQLDRLDARLREAAAAQEAVDAPALRASLDAFAGIAAEAARQTSPDPGGASRVRAQLALLERLQLAGTEVEAARVRAVNAGRGLLAALLGTPDDGVPGDGVPGEAPGAGPGPGQGAPGVSGGGSDPMPSPRASSRPADPGPSAADPAGGGAGGQDPRGGTGDGSGDGAGDDHSSGGGSGAGGGSSGGGSSGGGSSGGGSSGGGSSGGGSSSGDGGDGGSSTGNGSGGSGQGSGR